MAKETLIAEHEARVETLTEEVDQLVRDAYREGCRAGALHVTRELERYIAVMFKETEEAFAQLTPDAVEVFESVHRSATPSPAVAARFGAMGDVLMRLRARVHQLTPDNDAERIAPGH